MRWSRGLALVLLLTALPSGCRLLLPPPSLVEGDGTLPPDRAGREAGLPDQRGRDHAVDGASLPGTWIAIKAGSFLKGTPAGELCREPDENQHQVSLSRDFEIMAQEVTQAQFQSLLGYNPSVHGSCGPDCPVEGISWHQAAALCNALSAAASLSPCYSCTGSGPGVSCSEAFSGSSIYACPGFRLPTEAEWEYAARAGTTTSLFAGELTSCNQSDPLAETIGWYMGNSSAGPRPVGTKTPNSWGLHDTSGNVWEWVHDWYVSALPSTPLLDPAGPSSGTHRSCRGGAFHDEPAFLRSGSRGACLPGGHESWLGVRCARTRP